MYFGLIVTREASDWDLVHFRLTQVFQWCLSSCQCFSCVCLFVVFTINNLRNNLGHDKNLSTTWLRPSLVDSGVRFPILFRQNNWKQIFDCVEASLSPPSLAPPLTFQWDTMHCKTGSCLCWDSLLTPDCICFELRCQERAVSLSFSLTSPSNNCLCLYCPGPPTLYSETSERWKVTVITRIIIFLSLV